VLTKDVLFSALDWQHIGQCLLRLWHTASLYCRHVTSGQASSLHDSHASLTTMAIARDTVLLIEKNQKRQFSERNLV